MNLPSSRYLFPVIFSLLLLIFGFTSLHHYGVTWDEALGDFFFGQRYLSYFTSFDSTYLDFDRDPYPEEYRPDLRRSLYRVRPWEYYPFAGTLSAATSWILSNTLHLVDPFDGFHAVNLLFAIFLIWGSWFFLIKYASSMEACLAIALLFTLPRVVAHMMANIKDFPLMVLFTLTLFFLYDALVRGSGRRILAGGILWGCSLATKINALFVPFVIVIPLLAGRFPHRTFKKRSKIFLYGALGLLLGGVTLFALWPYLYHAPLDRFGEHLHYILNRKATTDPRNLLGVLPALLLTTPPLFLLLFTLGLIKALFGLVRCRPRPESHLRRFASNAYEQCGLDLFLIAWIGVVLGKYLLPRAINYDGVRHFLELFPAMAILASSGGVLVVRTVQKFFHQFKRIVTVVIVTLLLLPNLVALFRTHPHEIAYWNSLVGGIRGARERGVPQAGDYWAMSYRDGLTWINRHVPPGAPLVVPIAEHVVTFTGPARLRSDIRLIHTTTPLSPRLIPSTLPSLIKINRTRPLFVLFIYRREWGNQLTLWCRRHLRPVKTWSLDGVPLLFIYRIPTDGLNPNFASMVYCGLKGKGPGRSVWDNGKI